MKKRVVAVVAVIVLLVGASVASIIYMKSGKNDGSKTAYIYRDNELLRTVSLDDVKNPYTFRIEYGDGEYNDILVENGKIKIADASCPDKLCVNMGYISEPLMPITCLPNHLVIRIVNDGEESPSLDEVVVVGYGTQKKRTVTGAVSTVSIEDLKKAPGILQNSDTSKESDTLKVREVEKQQTQFGVGIND